MAKFWQSSMNTNIQSYSHVSDILQMGKRCQDRIHVQVSTKHQHRVWVKTAVRRHLCHLGMVPRMQCPSFRHHIEIIGIYPTKKKTVISQFPFSSKLYNYCNILCIYINISLWIRIPIEVSSNGGDPKSSKSWMTILVLKPLVLGMPHFSKPPWLMGLWLFLMVIISPYKSHYGHYLPILSSL